MLTDSEKIFRAAMNGESDHVLAEVFGIPEAQVRDTVRKEFAQRVSMTGEVAYSDPHRVTMKGQPEFNPSVLVTRKGMRIYDEMRRDEQVKAALKLKKHSVIAPGWQVVSPEGKGDDWEVTKFVKDVFENEIDGGIKNALLSIMSALDFGYSISEKVMAKDGNRVILSAIKTRKPHDFEFESDPHGNLVHLYQENSFDPSVRKPLPIKKFVIYSYQKEWSNHYGTSDLDAIYSAWWSKSNALKWLAMLLERFGIPPVFGIYNPARYTTEQQRTLQTMLSRLQAGSSGILPRTNQTDFELWSPELADQAATVFLPALDHYDKMIARGLLMPDMLGVTPQQSVGSQAQARVHFDSFMLIIQHIQGEVEAIVNEQIVKQLVDFNFTVDDYPEFKFLPLMDEDRINLMKEWREHVKTNSVTNTPDDENHIRQTLRFPEKSAEDIEREREKQRKAQPSNSGGRNGDIEDNSDPKKKPGKGDFSLPVSRQQTRFEAKVDFARIEAELDSVELLFKKDVRDVIGQTLRKTEKALAEKGLEEGALSVEVNRDKLAAIARQRLRQVFRQGRAEVRQETGLEMFAEDEKPTRSLQAARQFIGFVASEIAGTIDLRVQNFIRIAVMKSIEQGETADQAMERVQESMRPIFADPGDTDAEANDHLLQTIVRTNVTNLYNKGRITEARQPGLVDTVVGMQYSAVLDRRTTEICRHLDGRIFKINSSDLDALTPPNHFNCRSVLVPVTIADDYSESDFANNSAIGKAKDLAGKGFV